MPRLILFSGGVESTALLSLYKSDDVIMTVTDTSEMLSFDEDAVASILKFYGITNRIKASVYAGDHHKKTLYQVWSFAGLAAMYCAKHEEITEVWYGMHTGEPHVPSAKRDYETIMKGWNAMFPTVPFVSPFYHLSKLEQWELIPDRVKKLVRNCSYVGVNCGICNKCKELQELPDSFWCT